MATELDGADKDSLSSVVYSLVSGFGLTDRLGLYMEVFGDTGLSLKSGPANYVNGGFTYLVRPDIQLDIEGGVGLSDRADDWFAGIGLAVLWPRRR